MQGVACAETHGWNACRYKNIDKLIHYANEDGRMNLFYSTPATYTAAKHSYNRSWPLKTDDFFPYADNEFSYWTGQPFFFNPTSTSQHFLLFCCPLVQEDFEASAEALETVQIVQNLHTILVQFDVQV